MAGGATVATVADKAYYAAWAIRAGHKNGQTRKQTELRIKHMEYISQSTPSLRLPRFCIILEAWLAVAHKTAWLKENSRVFVGINIFMIFLGAKGGSSCATLKMHLKLS